MRAGFEYAMDEMMKQLPKITSGMDVNIQFKGPRAFEPTAELGLFDSLGIALVHGWLPDETV